MVTESRGIDFEMTGIGVRIGHEFKIMMGKGILSRATKRLHWFDADGNGLMEK